MALLPYQAVSEPGQLVKVESDNRLPDAYEAEYMRGQGMVLHRDKSRAPWTIHALLGGLTAMAIAGAFVAPGAWVSAVITAPILLTVWLLFSVLRVSVSEGHVNIQYGLFGPKIPIAAIQSAEVVAYDWKRFGGWGIKMNMQGEWIYNMPGDGGRAVRITWTDKRGRTKVTYIGSRGADKLAAAIGQARALAPARELTALPASKSS